MITVWSAVSKEILALFQTIQQVCEFLLNGFDPKQCLCPVCKDSGYCVFYGGYYRLVDANGMFGGRVFVPKEGDGMPPKIRRSKKGNGTGPRIQHPTREQLLKESLTNRDGLYWVYVRRVRCMNPKHNGKCVTHALLAGFIVPYQHHLLIDLVTMMASVAYVWDSMADEEASKEHEVALEEAKIEVTAGSRAMVLEIPRQTITATVSQYRDALPDVNVKPCAIQGVLTCTDGSRVDVRIRYGMRVCVPVAPDKMQETIRLPLTKTLLAEAADGTQYDLRYSKDTLNGVFFKGAYLKGAFSSKVSLLPTLRELAVSGDERFWGKALSASSFTDPEEARRLVYSYCSSTSAHSYRAAGLAPENFPVLGRLPGQTEEQYAAAMLPCKEELHAADAARKRMEAHPKDSRASADYKAALYAALKKMQKLTARAMKFVSASIALCHGCPMQIRWPALTGVRAQPATNIAFWTPKHPAV